MYAVVVARTSFHLLIQGGCRIYTIYAKAIRPFRVIRVGGARPGQAALFGEKFIYTFVLLQFEFIRLYGAALYAKKGILSYGMPAPL